MQIGVYPGGRLGIVILDFAVRRVPAARGIFLQGSQWGGEKGWIGGAKFLGCHGLSNSIEEIEAEGLREENRASGEQRSVFGFGWSGGEVYD